MESLELSKPFNSISGSNITSLSFDFDAISASDYRNVIALEYRLRGQSMNVIDINAWSKSTSSEFRIATAWIAALKGTKGLVLDDIDNLSFRDLIQLENKGIFFITDLA